MAQDEISDLLKNKIRDFNLEGDMKTIIFVIFVAIIFPRNVFPHGGEDHERPSATDTPSSSIGGVSQGTTSTGSPSFTPDFFNTPSLNTDSNSEESREAPRRNQLYPPVISTQSPYDPKVRREQAEINALKPGSSSVRSLRY